MADIGNAIDATDAAIESVESMIDSNLPLGGMQKRKRNSWSQEDRDSYEEWSGQVKRFYALRKKLLAIERAA